jgi:hypothetical protein
MVFVVYYISKTTITDEDWELLCQTTSEEITENTIVENKEVLCQTSSEKLAKLFINVFMRGLKSMFRELTSGDETCYPVLCPDGQIMVVDTDDDHNNEFVGAKLVIEQQEEILSLDIITSPEQLEQDFKICISQQTPPTS